MTDKSNGSKTSQWMLFAATLLGAFVAAFVAIKIAAAFTGPSQGPPNGSGAISVSGSNIGVNGSITGNAYIPSYANWNAYGTGGGGAAIYNDSGTYKKLMIVGNNSAGGNREVGIWDDLTVNGNITASGTITSAGNTGAVAAGNVSAGTFGLNTGNGNYSFPGSLGVGTASPGATLDVAGGINLEANGTNDAALKVGYTSSSPAGYYATYAP